MAETKIEWTATRLPDGTALPGYTFNPWVGCTKISPACDGCYAEALVKRWGGDFSLRRRTSAANWKAPLLWNREAARSGIRRKVFCASLADVFDNQVPREWRDDLWSLIADTPKLDWLLLTKRPQNIKGMLPGSCVEHMIARDAPWGDDGWPNVWLGTTVENKAEADRRIPHLLEVPARVRFLSCEPLLGPLDIREWLIGKEEHGVDLTREVGAKVGCCTGYRPPIDWVIVGGESGPGARPLSRYHVLSMRTQCARYDVPFHFKQWGEWLPVVKDNDGVRDYFEGDDGGPDGRFEGKRAKLMRTADETFARVGKRRAGALLEGREWREAPTL